MATNVTLPELGENIASGTIAKVLVAKGDSVTKNQAIIEVETDKAVVEVPTPVEGTVAEVRVSDGQTIGVGDVIITVSEGAAAANKEAKGKPAPATKSVEAAKPAKAAKQEETPARKETPRPADARKPAASHDDAEPEEPEPEESEEETEEPSDEEPRAQQETRGGGGPVAASPSVRRLAREIGVDLSQVRASDPAGRVSLDDVKGHAKQSNFAGQRTGAAAPQRVGTSQEGLPDFTRWGEVRRETMSTIRRRTAERLAAAWATIPHVTQDDKADVTELESFRKQYGPAVEREGGKLTVTAILVKVLAIALKKFPQFNTSIDLANNEIVYKDYFHIGVAVDTDWGLLVPVIRDADRKSITELAVELSEISERARKRKATLEEMQGGCMTITNLGSIGGVGFTPIINPPEVAILGVSRSRVEPVFRDGQFVPRTMLPVSLSYDHRIIDGADAARFARWVCEALEQPMLLFLEG